MPPRYKSRRRSLSFDTMEQRVVLANTGLHGLASAALAAEPSTVKALGVNESVERVLNGIIGASRNDLSKELDNALRKQSFHDESIRKVKTIFGKKKTGWEVDFGAQLNELGVVSVSNVKVSSTTKSITFDLNVAFSVRANGRAKTYALDVTTLSVSANGRQFVEGRFSAQALISKGVFIVRLNRSDVKMKQLTLDSIGRLGGEGARLLGNGITGAVRQWAPEIIRGAEGAVNKAVIEKAKFSKDLKGLVDGGAAKTTTFTYTILNSSGRSVEFRLPSGKKYTLANGTKGSYKYSGVASLAKMTVLSSGRTYTLKAGNHKLWWMSSEGRIGLDLNYDT